eukprot:CAMPEP_0174252938 /NCGR_PEP_ID=MMETSP0439-20130205/2317_1 /TAXON_ID=0 /ORGANISM="Stereomyxa ramosa, Strain Chinc5" /LENGTH=269 /DNA_ID=CAMNT_0015333663 /DNA_START=8 /DNA_END=817 /DNA_ORIENTATION=+
MKLFFFLVLFVSFALCTDYILDYKKVHYVDQALDGYNWLFRGNMPKNTSHDFAYDELMGFLRKRASEESLTLPPNSDIELGVISLNSLYNQNDTDIEIAYFKANPQIGWFENWSLYHKYPNPFNMTEEQIKWNLENNKGLWGQDDIINRIERIKTDQYLNKKGDRHEVIYFHCETGCDRTGEFGGSYMMRYMGKSFAEMMQINTDDCGRPPNQSAVYFLGWYCYYLQFEMGIDACCNCTNVDHFLSQPALDVLPPSPSSPVLTLPLNKD